MNSAFMAEINAALLALERDVSIGATVLTGSNKAFVAGADIKEMKDKSFADAYGADFIESWSLQTSQIKKPVVAAVNGHALGGGCEMAMMADILYCSASANFGQPEIKLGVIPGAGGSQRLARLVGKSRAMDLILTGRSFSGKEAGEWGVAARVFDTPEECVEAALKAAEIIASYSRIAIKAAKEVVNKSQDLGVRDGVEFERRLFHGLFGSEDQKIGECLPSWNPRIMRLTVSARNARIRGEAEACMEEFVNMRPLDIQKAGLYLHLDHVRSRTANSRTCIVCSKSCARRLVPCLAHSGASCTVSFLASCPPTCSVTSLVPTQPPMPVQKDKIHARVSCCRSVS